MHYEICRIWSQNNYETWDLFVIRHSDCSYSSQYIRETQHFINTSNSQNSWRNDNYLYIFEHCHFFFSSSFFSQNVFGIYKCIKSSTLYITAYPI